MKKSLLLFLTVTLVLLVNCGKDNNFRIGYVECDEVDIASKIPGRLVEIKVKNGDVVKKGDILAVIESNDIKARVEQARAGLDAAQAQLDMAQKGARAEEKKMAQRQFNIAENNLEIMNRTYERILKVYNEGGISDQEKDTIDFRRRVAQEQYEQAKAYLEMILKGARQEQIDALKAQVRAMEEKLNEALSYYDEVQVKAPIDAEIKQINAQTGEIITPGFPIISLLDPKPYVIFNLREDQFKGLQNGEVLKAFIPALEKDAAITVYYIAPLADFARYEATSEKGSWDVKTFEVRAHLPENLTGIRPGMTIKIFEKAK